MSRSELKVFWILMAACVAAVFVVGIGLERLGASSEVISLGLLVLLAAGGLGGGYAFDRYSTPPDRR